MPKGRCTNFDKPCPNYTSEELIDVPEGADFTCPECGRELIADEGSDPWPDIPVPVRIAGAAAAGLALLFGAYTFLFTGDAGSEAQAAGETPATITDVPERPAPGAARAAIKEDLSGYELAGAPSFAGSGGDGRFTYDVTLRPKEKRYVVPVVDFTAPQDWDAEAQKLSQHLVFNDALPSGKVYDADAKTATADAAAGRIETQWSGRFEAQQGTWQYVGDGRLNRNETSGESTSLPQAGDDEAVVTAGALEDADAEREAAVQSFEQRWQRLERDVKQRRASLSQSLPPPCTKDTEPLIRQITRLSSDRCPSLSGEERKQCYLRVQKLNSELGDCETRNQVRTEARQSMSGKVAQFRREQIDALRENLDQNATEHNQALDG